jgi:hypothetical protein
VWVKLSAKADVQFLNLATVTDVRVERDSGGGPVVLVRAPMRHLSVTGPDAVTLLEVLGDLADWDGDLDGGGDGADGTPANGEG